MRALTGASYWSRFDSGRGTGVLQSSDRGVMNRIIALALAGALAATVVPAVSAQAAPSNVYLRCGSTAYTTGWIDVTNGKGITYGRGCTTIRHDRDTVKVTYCVLDDRVDGIGLRVARDLSYVGDGFVTVVRSPGYRELECTNKQYPYPAAGLRWVQMQVATTGRGGGNISAFADRLFW